MRDMKIGVAGGAGRMGQTLLQHIHNTQGCVVSGGSEFPRHASIGADVGVIAGLRELNIKVTDSPALLFEVSDAVIDFTTPESTVENARCAENNETILIAGTTGLSTADRKYLETASKKAPVVYAANMSVGVNVLIEVVRQVASLLPEDQFDIEIMEVHHRDKADAPSGTALALGQAAAESRCISLDECSDRARDGFTGARKIGNIGFAVLRGGGIPGDHTVMFASNSERLELIHRAQDRSIFAAGAIRAALWARDKLPGLYSMGDVLGFDR